MEDAASESRAGEDPSNHDPEATGAQDLAVSSRVQRILETYADVRANEPFGTTSSIWTTFAGLNEALNRVAPVSSRPTLKATWSAGTGNWARIPWIAFLDSRETTTTQTGVYPVLLFRQDLSGVYLTIGQGVTEPKRLGVAEARKYLQGVAHRVRALCPELEDVGFRLDSEIELRSDPGIGRDYETSVVAHKLYERDAIPSDDELVADLAKVLDAYDRYIAEGLDDEVSELQRLAAQFRAEMSYPTESDKTRTASRDELAAFLSEQNLEQIVEDTGRFDAAVFNRFVGSGYGSPGSQSRVHQGLSETGDDGKAQLATSLIHLLHGADDNVAARIDDLLASPSWSVYGFKESLAVKALAISDPQTWLPLFKYTGDMGKKGMLQLPELRIEPLDEGEFDTAGKRAVESNRRLREVTEPLLPGDPWGQMKFLYWLRDRQAVESAPTSGLTELADELLLDAEWLAEAVDLLRDKRQIIFYGPPGTGKTFVARRLAEYIAQDASRTTVIQFHPSYAYEDFVQGYRPLRKEGSSTLQFELMPGPLIELAEGARESEADWCLLIDEINRGNIAKVFGELYYLLEYREDEIRLQYGDAFRLPKNLFIIGTMNTADRSIALLDAALRRRFHFIPFFPDQPPIAGLLSRWLTRRKPNMLFVADLLDRANARLPDRHLQIGPSHFMTPRLNDEWLAKIWKRSVIPYLEEQFFDEPERVKEFELEALMADTDDLRASSTSEGEEGDGRSQADSAEGMATD